MSVFYCCGCESIVDSDEFGYNEIDDDLYCCDDCYDERDAKEEDFE